MLGEHRHRPQYPARGAVLLPARAGLGPELAAQRSLRDTDRGAHRALVDVGEMLLRVAPLPRRRPATCSSAGAAALSSSSHSAASSASAAKNASAVGSLTGRSMRQRGRVDDHLAHRRAGREHAHAVAAVRRPSTARRTPPPSAPCAASSGGGARRGSTPPAGVGGGGAIPRTRPRRRPRTRTAAGAARGCARSRPGRRRPRATHRRAPVTLHRIATGTATSLAAEAATPTARDCNSVGMTDHDDVVRASFTRQVGLFSGPDSPFVRRPAGTVEQLEPLDPDMLVLDVACGAAPRGRGGRAATSARWWASTSPSSLLELGAARLADGRSRERAPAGGQRAGAARSSPTPSTSCTASRRCTTSAIPARAVAEMARVCRAGRSRRAHGPLVPVRRGA